MNNKYLKIIIPVLFAAAILYGLGQRKSDPYVIKTLPASPSQGGPESGGSLQNYYTRSQQVGNQETKASATFLAVGDIMLSRNVAAEIQKSGDDKLPYRKMADILESTDFNFGNLESPFYPIAGTCVTSAAKGIIGGHTMVFGAPCRYVKGLRDYNFQILNLANNHALDQGAKGLDFTTSLLSDPNVGIQYAGVGKNLDEAWRPVIVEAGGLKICFVGASYASVNDNGKATNDYVARIEDLSRLQSAIRNSKSACDFTVVTMHAGTEYIRTPNEAQTSFARAAIDHGADMVIGGHSHWTQTIEKYQDKYIFYSLGNFIFDQMWSQDTKEGLALKIRISKAKVGNPAAPGAATSDDLQGTRTPATLESVELIPVIIENYSTPRPATETEAKKILEKIGQTESILK